MQLKQRALTQRSAGWAASLSVSFLFPPAGPKNGRSANGFVVPLDFRTKGGADVCDEKRVERGRNSSFELHRSPAHKQPSQTAVAFRIANQRTGLSNPFFTTRVHRRKSPRANARTRKDTAPSPPPAMVDAVYISGIVSMYLACTLAATAGIGGGGMNVPILHLIFGYSYSDSLVLSICGVMGNLLAQFSFNWNLRHPDVSSRPLIYWDLATVLGPALVAGSSYGSVLAKVLPDTSLIVLAICMLVFASTLTLQKACKLRSKETEVRNPKVGASGGD